MKRPLPTACFAFAAAVVVAAAAAGLPACGHASTAPKQASSPVETARPEPGAPAVTAPEPEPSPAADIVAVTPAPKAEGCVYVAAPGKEGVGGISILGVREGGKDTYDMPDICPKQACVAGLTIDLPNRGGWKAGVYDIEIVTSNGTLSCRVTRSQPGPWSPPAGCQKQRELSRECVPPDGPDMGPIMISGVPASVRVAIQRDGTVLADKTMQPTYSSKRWDGWDCHPSCGSAKGSVDVK